MESSFIYAIIAGSIISLALFIKVWIMTNNVNALKKQLVDNNTSRLQVRIALAKKSSNLNDVLFDAMFRELSSAYYESESKDKEIASVINDYKEYYQRAGIDFPAEFANMNYAKFIELL